jgi:hypothetical protein
VNKLWTPADSTHPEFNYEQTMNKFQINYEHKRTDVLIPKNRTNVLKKFFQKK